jgi:D-alanyl-D-alanine carboxypeptidase
MLFMFAQNVTAWVKRIFLAAVLGAFAVQTAGAAEGKIEAVPDEVWLAMQGKSYNTTMKGCAQRDELRLVTLPYLNFKGETETGQLIVHERVAEDVRRIFVQLHQDKSYLIERMQLIDTYGGNDRASMAANNTSAYNCRLVSGSKRLSNHALGLAIDVNPLINPYVWKRGTSPPGGKPWDTPRERQAARNKPGMIMAESAITISFKKAGWGWGGDWQGTKDYQHFSLDGN